ncbi:Hypothetical protein NTJ_13493 [Nesidiocoris tenuis]|uniref:Uncharacterized protein n=1 Tax=Nesidiocoris tenuis TaxID=355587 RepID=A0ABN7B8G7_9HEMI|nr:Hypothetical protein NTJ_13493 [Nesidiocoris tenuis]
MGGQFGQHRGTIGILPVRPCEPETPFRYLEVGAVVSVHKSSSADLGLGLRSFGRNVAHAATLGYVTWHSAKIRYTSMLLFWIGAT